TDGVVMIDRLQVILERLARDGDALLDDERGFGGGQRVALDRVRCVGQFEVASVIKIGQSMRHADAKPIEFGFLGADRGQKVVHGCSRCGTSLFYPNAATPGSVLPSSHSRNAPPAEDTYDRFSITPAWRSAA